MNQFPASVEQQVLAELNIIQKDMQGYENMYAMMPLNRKSDRLPQFYTALKRIEPCSEWLTQRGLAEARNHLYPLFNRVNEIHQYLYSQVIHGIHGMNQTTAVMYTNMRRQAEAQQRIFEQIIRDN
jgi:hypothetical protein